MKKILLTTFCFFLTTTIYANEYVLPYPGPMPGNKLYKISEFIDRVQQYWYWGNIAKTRYYLSLSDKKLVEAKTLFEYKQYLLATNALQRSDESFTVVPSYIELAYKEGKDMSELVTKYNDAAHSHIEVLEKLKKELPETFQWTPEKTEATTLHLQSMIDTAISIRKEQSLEASKSGIR